jgi:ceramide glucosyltransferase
MGFFYLFAAIVIWLGIVSLRGGIQFHEYVKKETSKPPSPFTPFASIIAPCRGIDHGLKDNIASLFQQRYSAYELVFVTDRADDPSVAVIEDFIRESGVIRHSGSPLVSARIVIAEAAIDSGQKVHNLRVAVSQIDPRSEVIVFVDTDARAHSEWLASLVAPLADRGIGAATGYRWFIPVKGGLASHLRSVWNASIASALGARNDKNFCWGGSTAMRKSTFDELRIMEHWRGTVSDDFTMTRVLHEAKQPIHFVPSCLVPSLDSCTVKDLLEFTNRQLKITRVYAPHLWKVVLIGSLLFCAVFFGGIALVAIRALLGLAYAAPLVLLILILLLGAAKSYLRLKAVSIALTSYQWQFKESLPAHLLLWPLASLLYLCNAVASAFSRRIVWRGITYELKSTTEAVIIRRE